MMRCVIALAWVAAAVPLLAQEMVITRPGTPHYHWPGCPVVSEGKDVLAMTRGQAASRGLKPHDDCDPSKAGATPGRAKPAFVSVAKGDRFYHRDTCGKLGDAPNRVTLDEAAARKLYPCRTCKPPIRPRKEAKRAADASGQ